MMAEAVIDVLEAVEIDEMRRKRTIAAPGAGDLAQQPVGQQRAVRQVGERVVVREVIQVIFRALAVGDVERGGEHADYGVGAIAQRRLGGQEHALGAAEVGDFLFEARQGGLRGHDFAVERLVAGDVVFAEHPFGMSKPIASVGVDAGERRLIGVDEQDATFGRRSR